MDGRIVEIFNVFQCVALLAHVVYLSLLIKSNVSCGITVALLLYALQITKLINTRTLLLPRDVAGNLIITCYSSEEFYVYGNG